MNEGEAISNKRFVLQCESAVLRDYYNAIEVVMQRSQAGGRDGWLLQKRLNVADDHMLYLQEEGTVRERKKQTKGKQGVSN